MEGGCGCALLPMDEVATLYAQYCVAGRGIVECGSVAVAIEEVDGPMEQSLVVAYNSY